MLKEPANEAGMDARKLMEFHWHYDDIEKMFKKISGEFMNDTYEKINPRTNVNIHYKSVQDVQDATNVARAMKNGKAITRWGIPNEIWKIVLNLNKVCTK